MSHDKTYKPKHHYDFERASLLMGLVKHLAAGDFPKYMPIYQEADRELQAMIEREQKRLSTNDGEVQPDHPGKIVTPAAGPANSTVQASEDPNDLVRRPTPPDPTYPVGQVGGLTAEEKAAQDRAEAYRRGEVLKTPIEAPRNPTPIYPEPTTRAYDNGTLLNEPTRAADVDVERKI